MEPSDDGYRSVPFFGITLHGQRRSAAEFKDWDNEHFGWVIRIKNAKLPRLSKAPAEVTPIFENVVWVCG